MSSSSQGLLDCAITRPPLDRTPRRHLHLALTLSQEWVSCLCSRVDLQGLSSAWFQFNYEMKAPCLSSVDLLAVSIQRHASAMLFRALVHILSKIYYHAESNRSATRNFTNIPNLVPNRNPPVKFAQRGSLSLRASTR